MLGPRTTSCRARGLSLLFLGAFPFLFAIFALGQNAPNNEERQRGIDLYQQRNYVGASDVLKKVVKRNKTDDVAWSYLGFALLRQPNRIKDASKAFKTVLKLRPDSGEAHVGLAYSFFIQNKLSEAEREAQTALSVGQNMFEAHYIIGLVHLRAGEPKMALKHAEAAIDINANFAPPFLLKSQALVSSSGRSPRKRSAAPVTGTAKRAGKVAGLGPGPGALDAPVEPGPGAGPESGAELGVGPGVGTPPWLRMVYAEAANALETYLRLNPNAEEKRTWSDQLESLRFFGSPHTAESGDERVFVGGGVNTRARVLKKPEPQYTENARRAQVVGTVVLRAVFTADGTVKHILVLEGLPYGLTESAVKAARQIQFTPATFAGRPVSMFMQLEYNFNLY